MHHAAFFFDLDGTLYSRDELIKQLVEDQYNEFRNELSHRSCSDYVSRVLELDDHGYHPKEQVYAQIAKEWEIADDIACSLLAHFRDTYDSYCHLPEDTLFIGDHPVADIDGARGAGLAALWKKVPYWSMTRPDVLVVERLTQLLD